MSKALFALALLLAVAPSAYAQPSLQLPAGESSAKGGSRFLKVGLTGFGAANVYAMSDYNDTLTERYRETVEQFVRGGSAPQIENGISGGAGIRLIVQDRFLVEVVYELVMGSGSFGGQALKWDVDANANAMLYTVGVDLLSNEKLRFGFAAGIGRYTVDLKDEIVADGMSVILLGVGGNEIETSTIELDDGTSTGQHFMAFFEAELTPRLALTGSLGYRKVDLDGAMGTFSEDGVDRADVELEIPLDWSGFSGKLGFSYYVY